LVGGTFNNISVYCYYGKETNKQYKQTKNNIIKESGRRGCDRIYIGGFSLQLPSISLDNAISLYHH
jgi:hypothetical protein